MKGAKLESQEQNETLRRGSAEAVHGVQYVVGGELLPVSD